MADSSRTLSTASGFLAIAFWSTTVGVSRSLTERLGTFTSAAMIYTLAGVLGCAVLLRSRASRRDLKSLPPLYLLGCGALFVAYMVCLYVAVGFAADRRQVLEVALINYLWPSLTLALSVPLLRNRPRAGLVPGVVIAMAGIFLALNQRGGTTLTAFAANLRTGAVPYVAALGAAVTWALYSNLSRRWAAEASGGAVPVFLLASGVVLAAMRVCIAEDTSFGPRAAAELLYMAVFPALIAYVLWDAAMRRGNMVLVAAGSYLTPLLSVAIGALYLGEPLSARLWAACGLVIAGAVTCKLSLVEREPESEVEAMPVDGG